MEILAKKLNAPDLQSDIVVQFVSQDKTCVQQLTLLHDDVRSHVADLAKDEGFVGKPSDLLWVHRPGLKGVKWLLVVGLGKKEEVSLDLVRSAMATAWQSVKSKSISSVSVHVWGVELFGGREVAEAMTEAVRLADYRFGRYKKEKDHPIKQVALLVDAKLFVAAQKGIVFGECLAKGTLVARDLVNTPGLHMSPSDLVEHAKKLTKGTSNVRMRVFDQAALERMGAGGILGVAKGSDHPPFLVHMVYAPTKKTKKKIAIVGKGVTFDSGGISIKPADYMMTMKCDMAGAADVIGLFSVLSDVQPSMEVHGIFATVENMPSGGALRPGDVIEIMNKKTVEVLNTDAEGRLILADALMYAHKLKPDAIIDLATLTGACVVALGEEITGVMSNTPALAQKILMAAARAGEKMWELPLEKNYRKLIQGDISDLKNIGGRWGGTLTAGLFLQEFVDKTPWAHLDIAGPAFAERDISALEKKGATGHGVRTLIRFLQTENRG